MVEWAPTDNIITSAAFSPDGKMAVAGLFFGECVFFNSEKLNYKTQIECRNARGKFAKGRKVTGLEFSQDGKQLLVTTNDSRVRLFDVPAFGLKAKFKGLQNDAFQIKARFSPDCKYVICGSQTQYAYIWNTSIAAPSGLLSKKNNKTESYEYFKADKVSVTAATFLPTSTIRLSRGVEATATTQMIMSAGWEGGIKFYTCRMPP